MDRYFPVIDIGASSGRHIWGCIRDHRICLEDESAGNCAGLPDRRNQNVDRLYLPHYSSFVS